MGHAEDGICPHVIYVARLANKMGTIPHYTVSCDLRWEKGDMHGIARSIRAGIAPPV